MGSTNMKGLSATLQVKEDGCEKRKRGRKRFCLKKKKKLVILLKWVKWPWGVTGSLRGSGIA
jgi:hypothetical protein